LFEPSYKKRNSAMVKSNENTYPHDHPLGHWVAGHLHSVTLLLRHYHSPCQMMSGGKKMVLKIRTVSETDVRGYYILFAYYGGNVLRLLEDHQVGELHLLAQVVQCEVQ
jgi:hypothetical protein